MGLNSLIRLVRSLTADIRSINQRMVRLDVATVSSLSPLAVLGADGNVELKALGWYRPRLYDPVLVLSVWRSAYILGSTTANQAVRPSMFGTVTAYTGGASTLTASVGGVSYVLPFAQSYAPVVGHTVLVVWQDYGEATFQGHVTGRTTASASGDVTGSTTATTAPDTGTVPTLKVTSGTTTIPATDARTWRSGWRGDTLKLFQGSYGGRINHAYLFYGSGFDQLDGVTVVSARIRMHALPAGAYGATTARLAMHGATKRGTTEPARYDAFDGPALADNAKGWYSFPTARAQDLVDRVRRGVAIASDLAADYAAFAGLSGDDMDSLSGAIEITWTRS